MQNTHGQTGCEAASNHIMRKPEVGARAFTNPSGCRFTTRARLRIMNRPPCITRCTR